MMQSILSWVGGGAWRQNDHGGLMIVLFGSQRLISINMRFGGIVPRGVNESCTSIPKESRIPRYWKWSQFLDRLLVDRHIEDSEQRKMWFNDPEVCHLDWSQCPKDIFRDQTNLTSWTSVNSSRWTCQRTASVSTGCRKFQMHNNDTSFETTVVYWTIFPLYMKVEVGRKK